MLYHCFKELKPDYETIVISPSTLEKELVPPAPFVQELSTKKKAATFWAGNIVEDIVRVTITKGKQAGYDKCNLRRQYMNPARMQFSSSSWVIDSQFKWLYEGMEQIVDLSEPYYGWDIYNLRSHNSLVEIDASWYKVLLKGECDFWVDGQCLFDVKTAKKRWDNNKRDIGNYQSRFYSRMQFLAHPEAEQISFSYIIFIKNKKMILQDMTRIFTREECESFVWEKLKEYLTKVHRWEIKASEEALNRL